MLRFDDLDTAARDADASNPAVTEELQASETAYYIFTSGTTGLPKASRMTHFRWLKSMSGLGSLGVRLRRTDVLYSCLPLYHNNALTVALSSVLAAGATLGLGRKFSASNFWNDAQRNGATAFIYIGEICRYLLNQPPREDDATTGSASPSATVCAQNCGTSSPNASVSTASRSSTVRANATSPSSTRSTRSAPPASARCPTPSSSTTPIRARHVAATTAG